MPSKIQDFDMYVDSDVDLTFEFATGDVADLSTADIIWEMSNTVDGVAILTKNRTDMVISGNTFKVFIQPADNVSLVPGIYYHEARVTDINGNTRPVSLGKITLIDTITSS